MIERTRRVCREDERLAAAMMYGSFAQGEGDGFSERLDRRCAETFSAPWPGGFMMRDDTRSPWRTLRSRNVYENPWISVREDSVIRPDGEPGIYGVVHYKNTAVGVLPVEEDHVYLVGQYRYPLERYSWEIPEGGCPKDEEPLRAAQRAEGGDRPGSQELAEARGGLPLQLGRRRARSVVSRHGSRTWGAAARRDRGHRRSTRLCARPLPWRWMAGSPTL